MVLRLSIDYPFPSLRNMVPAQDHHNPLPFDTQANPRMLRGEILRMEAIAVFHAE